MRYVIVDQDGAGRDYFDDLTVLEDELRRVRAEDSDLLADLLVTVYDDAGTRVGSKRAEDMVPLMETMYLVVTPRLVATGVGENLSEQLQPA